MTALILTCSFLNIFSIFPESSTDFNGSGTLILKALSALFSFLLLIPAYLLLRRHPGQSVLECAYTLTGRFGGVFAAVVYYIFFMAMGVNSITGVEFFLTSTVYSLNSNLLILLLFSLLIYYAVSLGIEPLGRVAVVIGALFLLAAALLVAFLVPQFDLTHFYSPLYDGLSPYIDKLPALLAQNNVFMPMLLLAPFLKKHHAASFTAANLIYLAVTEALMFSSVAVLGDYIPNNLLSMHTLVTMVNTSRLHRVDSIHIAIWVLLSFIRTAVIIYCACLCLRSVLPPRLQRFAVPFTSLLFFAGGYLFSCTYDLIVLAFRIVYSGIPTAVTALLIPSALLIISLIKKKKDVSKNATDKA